MSEYKILTAEGRAKRAEFVTVHGTVQTPVFMNVGTVAAINETLLDHPERVNSDPDEAWFIKVSDVTDTDELLDAAAYEAFVEEEKAKEQ